MNDKIAVFSANGLAKKFPITELTAQKRAGKGLVCYKPTNTTGNIVAAALISDEDNILVVGTPASICISAKEVPELGRVSIGNQVIKNSKINSVSKV